MQDFVEGGVPPESLMKGEGRARSARKFLWCAFLFFLRFYWKLRRQSTPINVWHSVTFMFYGFKWLYWYIYVCALFFATQLSLLKFTITLIPADAYFKQ